MPRRMPVKDPVELTYVGPPGRMYHNAYAGPVSGNGYLAEPGQTIVVERVDREALLATGDWSEPEPPEQPKF